VRPGGGGLGPYRVRTSWVTGGRTRGRDVRDVFVAHSDGGAWSAPVRVSDAPPYYDDWLPEVGVGPDGRAYVAWYDWRDTPASGCSAVSIVSLSRSIDGGGAWQRLGTVTDRPSDWSLTSSNLVPNQGDYIGLSADEQGIYVGWADARGESPDVYLARIDPSFAGPAPVPSPTVALQSLRPNPAPGAVTLGFAVTPGLPARLELWDVTGRRLQSQPLDAGGSTEVRFTPRPGLRSGVYLLRVVQGSVSASARLVIVR